MDKVGILIKNLRLRRGLTQGQLATYAGVKRSWLSLVESGRRKKPEAELLAKLAPILGVSSESLLAAAGYPVGHVAPARERTTGELLREALAQIEKGPILVPVIESAAVSAGPGGYAEMQVPYIPRPHERGHNFVAVPVVGDCMEPELHAGDIAIIDLSAEPHAGEIVAAECDHEYLIKRLERRNSQLWLVANQGQEPIRVTEQVRILGVVRGAYKPL